MLFLKKTNYMEQNKIVIDLKKFEGKSILELKQEIHSQLSKINITYSAPNPKNPNRTFDYQPYTDWNFQDKKNSEIIKEIKLV